MSAADVVDAALEATVVGSFTRVGYLARRRLDRWGDDSDATGKVIVITGATSGLGLAAARRWRAAGATVEMIARNPAKAEPIARELGAGLTIADVGDLDEVRSAAAALLARHARVDVLVHNAGALDATWGTTRQGLERTLATHVVGPYLLTTRLLDAFTRGSRVLWVSSGGQYAAPLDMAALDAGPTGYDGVRTYALAKRAQVTLSELMAERLAADGVAVHAMHPGWADTPGVARSLPRFYRALGPWLRSPDEGADTLVWLALADDIGTGKFWLDRRPRHIHRGLATWRADTEAARDALWAWVTKKADEELRARQ
jgi:dehydrogenase/reductase SDR family protein 12